MVAERLNSIVTDGSGVRTRTKTKAITVFVVGTLSTPERRGGDA